MRTVFDTSIADKYKSPTQKVRVLSEAWVVSEIYCPNCSTNINQFENSRPVADFYCPNCTEEYELKSKRNSIGLKIVDGAYRTMIERLHSANNPNLFLLNYDFRDFSIINFLVIPKHFFVPDIIERRTALSHTARRAGWVGCNILLQNIPNSGKIFFIKNKQTEPKEQVLAIWKKTLFLRDSHKTELRGWILDTMNCIDKLGKSEFTLDEMYSFEKLLSRKYTGNKHIKDKIRQQLQFLRDRGYLDFIGRGIYRLK